MQMRQATSLLLTAVLTGALGYWAGRSSTPDAGGSPGSASYPKSNGTGLPHSGTPALENPDVVYLLRPAMRGLLGSGPVADDAMQAALVRVLAEPDAVRRTAAVSLLLDNMNAANAEGIRNAFQESTAKSGRLHDSDWGLMLRQYGKVLGLEAMQRLKDVPKEAQKALEGWAIADPAAAHAWLSPDHPDFGSLRQTMLSGIALTDPEMAFRLILSEPGAPMDPRWIIRAGVLGSGTDGITAALQKALDSAAPQTVDHPAFGHLFGELANTVFRQKWEAKDSAAMMPWLESLKGQPFVTGDMIGHGAMDVILQGNLTGSLDWLDRMEGATVRPEVSRGLLQGMLGNVDLLARADAGTLERIIARFPADSQDLAILAQAMAGRNPAHAARLQSLLPPAP